MINIDRLKLLFTCLACGSTPLFAQDGATSEQPVLTPEQMELSFADKLCAAGYTDFARNVLTAAKVKFPAAVAAIEMVETRVDLREGKFDEVKSRIEKMPQADLKTWLTKLELARYYVAYQKYTDADTIYKAFFSAVKPKDSTTKNAYVEACYSYIQILQSAGRNREALDYYRKAIAQNPPEQQKRQLQSEVLAQLFKVADETQSADEKKKLIAEAEATAKQMVWIQDRFFGDAIIGLARAKMERNDISGAQKMVADYQNDLLGIHEQIKKSDPTGEYGLLRTSPMPACRFLLGSILWDKAKAEIAKGDARNDDLIKNLLLGERDPKTKKRNGQGAYNHVVNVFVGYPESVYAMQAGEMAEEIQQQILSLYKTRVGAVITPAQKASVRKQQYVGANILFSENKYKEASEAFLGNVSRFGLSTEAIPALVNTAQCYLRMGLKGNTIDPAMQIYADTIIHHLAEGCSGVEEWIIPAGNGVIECADFYASANMKQKQRETIDLFFRFYPKHPRAPKMALDRAKELLTAGDVDAAIKSYQTIVDNYTDKTLIPQRQKAIIELLTDVYGARGKRPDASKELELAEIFVKSFDPANKRPGQMMAVAQFLLGNAYRQKGEELRDATRGKADADLVPVQNAYKAAIKTFDSLVKVLSTPDNPYQSTQAEKTGNDDYLQGALYQEGLCCQRMPAENEKQAKAFQGNALKIYNRYMKQFPKGKYAPKVLLQIGTLYTVEGKIDEAQKQLDMLAREFPDSDDARNSIPMLADSLFKMGMRAEGISKYKQMLGANGKYTPAQYIEAAKKLLDARENELAVEACDKTIADKPSVTYAANAMLIKAKALLAMKKPAEAYDVIKIASKEYGGTVMAIDINLAQIDVIGDLIQVEKNSSARNDLIGAVRQSVNFVKRQRKDAQTKDLDLAVANVAAKKYYAEKKLNLGKNVIQDSLGAAIIAYDTIIFGATGKPDVAQFEQDAFFGLNTMLFESKTKEALSAAVDNANKYLELFPDGKYVTQMNNWINQAKIELGE